jgi:hypothetical protein
LAGAEAVHALFRDWLAGPCAAALPPQTVPLAAAGTPQPAVPDRRRPAGAHHAE